MAGPDDLDENFRSWTERNGTPSSAIPLSPEADARLSTVLPPSLMNYLRVYGFGSYFDDLFRLCDPVEFQSVLALVLGADSDLSVADCHVVGTTAFGVLTVWSERYRKIRIDLPTGFIWSAALAPTPFAGMEPPARPVSADAVAWSVLPMDAKSAEYVDDDGKPMYARCRKAHGRLAIDECYGFFPALAVAGETGRRVENVKRVKALEHFAILAQLAEFHLVRLAPGGHIELVRPIG